MKRVKLGEEEYYKIGNSDELRPFFMSVVSDGNHWMFISSNGGLTAGRKNAEYALFPYYTDDKITESTEVTGSRSIFRVGKGKEARTWEPFSIRGEGRFQTTRNLYKSVYGNAIVFEEVNHDLDLSFNYRWNSSNEYGFVRTATLRNTGTESREIEGVDGLTNLLPYGVGSELQNRSSNLVDAYKRSELDRDSGLGIFALSAIIVDKAEPSEALKANVAWSLGTERPTYLLSARQLDAFRAGEFVREETDVKGEKGAYLVQQQFRLMPGEKAAWTIVANVNQTRGAVARLIRELADPGALAEKVRADVHRGTRQLIKLNATADGLQLTADSRRDTRHFSNVLFNVMRGGIFDDNYAIEKTDFSVYLRHANPGVSHTHSAWIAGLDTTFSRQELVDQLRSEQDPDLIRLSLEYLPLKFSRRHGDPSRPWNRFSINTTNETDGSKILDYEGNWRDIFQNWEALAYAFPDFIDGMILKFLNATTFDGYNPYRVTKGGFDWETIEADDPWSYIGYWGDHQVIYLLKFLEFCENYRPGRLAQYFDRDIFVYANVPYRIKSYPELLTDPKDTITFDHAADQAIRRRKETHGADGALLQDQSGNTYRVNFVEKILAMTLAKMANFIPEGGIWMNTQRPEWNDANNALVGNGVSMVTLYYLRRFLKFWGGLMERSTGGSYGVSTEMKEQFMAMREVLDRHTALLSGRIGDADRKSVLDGLGSAADAFRSGIYTGAFTGDKAALSASEIRDFIRLSLAFLDHSIAANRRSDRLYHAYNLMTPRADGVAIDHLSEMLEGQVAVLSSGYLEPKAALDTLDAMKKSRLFREDQYSYLLYPDKELPGFLERNTVPATAVSRSELLQEMVRDGNPSILEKDVNGEFHFNGNFKNAGDLKRALDGLADTTYAQLATAERQLVLDVFEEVFDHKSFTGRSGTFYGYEGLGSIYWHMVSKLQLAVQECCWQALENSAGPSVFGRLVDHYYEINAGIGVHKSPELYGAFPTDPYSHTPAGKGAQQPGMTGQVKEDILCRWGELGLRIEDGKLHFMPALLRKTEFLTEAESFPYFDVQGAAQTLDVPRNSLCFTCAQVPVTYTVGEEEKVEVIYADGRTVAHPGGALDAITSKAIWLRNGEVKELRVFVEAKNLLP